ncbi:acyl-CoA dehydrogenase family protein [Streptomyces sp. NPDC060194]|uniref:acyl-CoA dehydrogenase family protein n=1 Tax=Streptomyces sp. NPDC060194 TaxID=3347069 RepID=UPI0036517087
MSTAADLLYSEDEEHLRAAVRELLTDLNDPAAVTVRAEAGDPYDPALLDALAAMGLNGLLVPEKLGGQGAGHREAAVVLEELGRAAAPAPYLTGAVMAAEALLALDTGDATVAGLLADLAAGRKRVALAISFATLPHYSPSSSTTVADAAGADVLLVLRPDGLYAVEDAETTPLTPLDLTRPLADVDGGTGVRLPGDASAAVGRALLAGAGLLASEQLGLADWCLTETVRYLKERKQFNRPVGGFQAIKHRLAQLWLEVENARAAARYAADALATGNPDTEVAVALAQAYCSEVAVHAAEECVQLHGGLGMTWEHPAHLYLKRAKADHIALGTPGRHRARLAELVDLPEPLPTAD